MARDGNGTFNLPQANFTSGTVISSSAMNSDLNDIAAGLTQSLSKDGQTTPTANIPMGNFSITNLGNGTARTSAVTIGQVQDGAVTWCGTAGGTADAITLTPVPAITGYQAGRIWAFKAGSSPNTIGNPTVAISGLTTRTVQKNGGLLAPGDIAAGLWYQLLDDGANLQLSSISPSRLPSAALINVASAATINLASVGGPYLNITGSVNITNISNGAGAPETTLVIGNGTPTFQHGSGLTIQGSANYTAAVGDVLKLIPTGNATGTLTIARANGAAVAGSGGSSGALEFLGSSGNVSNQSSVVFNITLANYSAVKFIGIGIFPQTNNVPIGIKPRVNGTYIGGGSIPYMQAVSSSVQAGVASADVGLTLNGRNYSNTSTASASSSVEATIFARGPGKDQIMGTAQGIILENVGTWPVFQSGFLSAPNTSAVNSFEISASSGNISGQFYAYGVKIT
jgi:hypothetical protein